MKTWITVLIMISPAAAQACSPEDARAYYEQILQTVAEPCDVRSVSGQKIDWWGGKYYRLEIECLSGMEQRRVYALPDGKCSIAY